MNWQSLVPTILSAALGGLISGTMAYVAVRVDQARMRAEREADSARIVRLEKKVGIENGEPEFIRRQECFLMHEGTTALRAEFRTDFLSLRDELREMRTALDEMRGEIHSIKTKGG